MVRRVGSFRHRATVARCSLHVAGTVVSGVGACETPGHFAASRVRLAYDSKALTVCGGQNRVQRRFGKLG